MPLFTGVRGRVVLRSSFARYCIDCSPEAAIPVRIVEHVAHSTQHLGSVHKDAFLRMQHRRRQKEIWHRLLASGTLSLHQDRVHILSHRVCSETPTVRRCQKCQKGIRGAFGTFGTRWLAYLKKIHALHNPTRSERGSFIVLPWCKNWGVLYVNKLCIVFPSTSIISV